MINQHYHSSEYLHNIRNANLLQKRHVSADRNNEPDPTKWSLACFDRQQHHHVPQRGRAEEEEEEDKLYGTAKWVNYRQVHFLNYDSLILHLFFKITGSTNNTPGTLPYTHYKCATSSSASCGGWCLFRLMGIKAQEQTTHNSTGELGKALLRELKW